LKEEKRKRRKKVRGNSPNRQLERTRREREGRAEEEEIRRSTSIRIKN